MHRLRVLLVCLGLWIALFAVSGGANAIVALYEGKAWSETTTGWTRRFPGAPFALVGIGLAVALIVLSRTAPGAGRVSRRPRTSGSLPTHQKEAAPRTGPR